MNRSEEKQITAYVHSLGLLLVKVISNTFDVISPQGHALKDYKALLDVELQARDLRKHLIMS